MRRTLAQRAREAGINYKTAWKRRARGWQEGDLLVAPRPANHCENKARPTSPSHPWRRTPGCVTKKAELSALELRKRAKRERANG